MRPTAFLAVALLSIGCSKLEPPVPTIELLTEGDLSTGMTVALTASGSTDPNEDPLPLSFEWSLTDLPADSFAAFNRSDTPSVSFLADAYGDYTVALIVDNGELTAEGTLIVTVTECGNAAPTVAGTTALPTAPNTGDVVQLSGSWADTDNEAGCSLEQYLQPTWTLTRLPEGSTATLNDPTVANPSFVGDIPGDYGIELVVTDETGLSSEAATLSVTVSDCGDAAPTIDQVGVLPAVPFTGDQIDLTIAVSDGDATTCGLDQDLDVHSLIVDSPAGSMATMQPGAGLTPAFVADLPGDYTVRTTVDDGTGRSDRFDTVVTVSQCGSNPPDAQVQIHTPIIAGPSDSVVPVETIWQDTLIWLDASASTDPDTDASGSCGQTDLLSYHWWFYSKPPGSQADFNDPSLVAPSFRGDRAGFYELFVDVSDGTHTDSAYVGVVVIPAALTSLAPGYDVEFVDGQSGLWDNPQGITVDGDGYIYVVQSGYDGITRTTAAGTMVFSVGGGFDNLSDIEWHQASDTFFVSDESNAGQWNDAIYRVDQSGSQSRFSDFGELDRPQGLHLFTDSNSNERLVVVERNLDRVVWFDPADTSGTAQTLGSDWFSDQLNTPWGVTAMNVGGTNTYWVTDLGNDELWREDGNTDLLTDIFDNPRDVEYSASSGKLVVADAQGGTIWLVDDCGNPQCAASAIATGFWEPFGLAFETPTSLLVTDQNGDALYRFTGPF